MSEDSESNIAVNVFAPPSDYAFETELQEPAPRPVPGLVYDGPYVQGLKLLQWSLLTVAVLCMVAQFLPFVQRLAWYILPLGYIGWVGVLFMAGYLAAVIYLYRGSGLLKYFTHGQPVVGEILEIAKTSTVVEKGNVTHFAFVASVRLVHPETGKPWVKKISSKNYAIDTEANYECTLRVGDFVSVLYLPESKETPFQLYGFLGLNDGVKFIHETEPTMVDPLDSVFAIGLITTLVGGFVVLLTHEVYQSLDFPINGLTVSIITGGAIFGLLLLFIIYRYELQEKLKSKEFEERVGESALRNHGTAGNCAILRWAKVVAMICGAPFMGGLLAFGGLLLCNGLFDNSAVRHHPVQLEEAKVETYALIIRHYKIRYILEGEAKQRTLLTSPSGLARLSDTVAGTAIIKEGNLGWPWVVEIVPMGESGSPS